MNSWRNEPESPKAMLLEAEDMPGSVAQWLAQLTLLEGVPLSYLAADERLLPPESIRFFYVDPQWTAALADGATSIGLHTTQDAQCARRGAQGRSIRCAGRLHTVRQLKMHPNHRQAIRAAAPNGAGVLSGFLMRSALVAHWKGIELRGFGAAGPLEILRMTALSDRLLLCIFDGALTSVQMFEPKEALHFGTRGSKREIELRRVDDGHEGEPLYEADGKTPTVAKVPVEANGRVNVSELAKTLAGKLNTTEELFGSPQLALEMLSVAGQCMFETKP